MPTYEYACAECAERLEAVQKFSDDPLTVCPACGGRLRKLFSPVGIVFKGSGFYRTDSRSSSVSGPAAANGSSADSAPAGEKPAGEKSAGADAKKPGSEPGTSGTAAKSEKKAGTGGSGTATGTGTKVA